MAALSLPHQKAALRSRKDVRKSIAIIVPAHNESAGLQLTLGDIQAQLLASDQLLVVADNCTDDTAAVALASGAEVIVRDDPTHFGKGYALDYGLKHLRSAPPAVVIVIDADCRLGEGTIDQLATTCVTTRRPVQALNLMAAPEGSPINYRVAEFAWRVKNWVRPVGLSAFNLPCQLMGTGMAFPWDLINNAKLACKSALEDVKLGLDLAQTGMAPLFVPSARVESHFPWSAEGALSQRRRWEGGHIRILTSVPRLIGSAIAQRNLGLLVLSLDLLVPPLSLLVILVTGMFLSAGLAVVLGFSSTALFISTASLTALTNAVFLAWFTYGREVLPTKKIFLILTYIMGKIPLYRQIFADTSAPLWIKTDRPSMRTPRSQTEP